MISVASAEFFVGLISFFLAYVVSVTIAQAFRAWTAYMVGDDTGKELGYMTLNPFFHIDAFSIIILEIFYALGIYTAWSPYIPLDIARIEKPFRAVKVALCFLSTSFAYFMTALCGIIALVATFDVKVLSLTRYMVLFHQMSHLYLAQVYPTYSSWLVVVGFILISLVYLNMILCVFTFITDMFSLYIMWYRERTTHQAMSGSYSMILIPLLLLIFFSGFLRLLAVNAITAIGLCISSRCGIITPY
ncbi:MAG TPA: hypothetical protein VEK38_01810 [Candidatus Bathyarchaeia archaeon]|nr:hypothetical protein [Candidatus Bathyarchaeia archaeon]